MTILKLYLFNIILIYVYFVFNIYLFHFYLFHISYLFIMETSSKVINYKSIKPLINLVCFASILLIILRSTLIKEM